MPESAQPFPLPGKLPTAPAALLRYWTDLKRAENPMPFADDVSLSRLKELAGNLILVDVFAGPQRFRFNYIGDQLIGKIDANLTGKFADEVKLRSPLDFFIAQSSATVEAGAPTWYSSAVPQETRAGYSRIMLPAWGDGRINLLFGAITTP